MIMALDAAAPFAGHLPDRPDLTYFVTHPCHPPIFNDETDPAAQEELWKQANIKVLEDLAAYPLYMQNLVYARTPAVDFGHDLVSSLALYPQITELTTITEE